MMIDREPFIGERTALEAALLRELRSTWDEIAHNHFKGALRRPVLALSEGDRRLGEWNRAQRTISISRRLVVQQPWGVVREVLKHEMAHQFVDEILGIHDQTAHGPAFARVCEAHGFDASARGMPPPPAAAPGAQNGDGDGAGGGGAGGTGDGEGPGAGPLATVARRIARLLALAESPNAHEAAAAMNEARRLMLLHNIDPARASEPTDYRFRHVGAVKARNDVAEKVLAGILAQHFFVSVIWVPAYLPLAGRRGRVLELCGTPSNLDVAVFVHGFLTATGERLWRAHKRAAGIRSDRERRRFVAGMMIGFQEKLDAGAREGRRAGLEMVVHADAQREAYLRRRYPRRASRGGGAIERTPAYEQGRAAGRQIVLARPVTAAGSAAAPRLLPPRAVLP